MRKEKQKYKDDLVWKFHHDKLLDKNNDKIVQIKKDAEALIAEKVESFEVDKKELGVFKYQFILNYMSKPNIDAKIKYIHEIYDITMSNSSDSIYQVLLPALSTKKIKNKMEGNVQVNR